MNAYNPIETELIWLSSASAIDPKLYGHKAANLHTLIQNGVTVPDALCLPSDFCQNLIQDLISKFQITDIKIDDWLTDSKQHFSRLEKLVKESNIELELLEPIIQEIENKSIWPVAVRSSGLKEDGKDKSAAGIYESILCINNRSQLKQAIQQCLIACFSPRVLKYFNQEIIESRELPKISLMIQQLISAEHSGVCFTKFSDSKPELVHIETINGLGELLVAGDVTPAKYLYDFVDRELLSYNSGSQKVGLFYNNGKAEKLKLAPKQELSNSALNEVVDLALTISNIYKSPQDIEWATAGCDIYALQARAVTTDLDFIPDNFWKCILRGRHYGVQYAEISVRCLSSAYSKWQKSIINKQLYAPSETANTEDCYIDKAEWNAFMHSLDDNITPSELKDFESDFYKAADSYLQYCKSLQSIINKNVTAETLLEIYTDYQKRALEYCTYIWTCYIVSNRTVKKATDLLKEEIDDQELLSDILSSKLDSEKVIETTECFMNALKQCDSGQLSSETVLEQYAWVSCLDIHHPPMNNHSLQEELTNFEQLNVSHKFLTEYKNLLTTATYDWLVLTKGFEFLRDRRDDYRRKCVYLARTTLFNEIARKANVPIEELSYWTQDEIITFLRNSKKPVGIKKRQEGFVLSVEAGIAHCFTGITAQEYLLKNGIDPKYDSKMTEGFARGEPAYKGIVTGRVRILESADDHEHVTKEDILFAQTTHPNYISAMNKAKAFVTDEGGQCCHAAIVARELKKPCVVGCRVATAVFKNGDLVTVNADAGIITKVNRN